MAISLLSYKPDSFVRFLRSVELETIMKFMLGVKLDMTQQFGTDGRVQPLTRVHVGPCVVTHIRTQEKDGYTAVQVGLGKKKKPSKAMQGHLQGLYGVSPKSAFRFLKEFRVDAVDGVDRGSALALSAFAVGDILKVTGTSKGRGFAGVVKRHGFHGHPTTHGHKDQERMPGSIGAGGVQHVFKGKRMGGRMGGEQVTVQNLQIVAIDTEKGIFSVRGSVPGARNGLIMIRAEGTMVFENPIARQENAEEVPLAQEPTNTPTPEAVSESQS